MIKYYCDRCEKELNEKRENVTYRIRGFAEMRRVYCLNCLAFILGEQDFNNYLEMLEKKEKRRKELKEQL